VKVLGRVPELSYFLTCIEKGNEMHDTKMQCKDMQYAGHEYEYQVYQE